MGGNSAGAANASAFSAGGYIGPTSASSQHSLGAAGGSDLIPGPIGTGAALGVSSYAYGGTSWEEFCERHARAAASDFAKACITYINGNLPPEEARNIQHRSFSQKFVESFAVHYDTEFFRRRSTLKIGAGSLDFDEEHEVPPRLLSKSLLRRLSFKGLRKGKFPILQAFFHKNSDDVDGSGKQSKTKLAKIVVECRKEGYVNNLTPESLDQPTGSQKWEKCRLALVKAVGGYMLEFYTPPKSAKPRSGVFCFLISEARETTALEMPDRLNTFVLKADNNMEYVIEAESAEEMRSWLATIRYCMRTPPTQQPLIESDVIAAAMQTSPTNPSGSSALGGIQNPQYQQQGGSNGNLVAGGGGVVLSSSLSADSALASAAIGQGATSASDINAINELGTTPPSGPPEIPMRPHRGEQRLSASSNFDGVELTENDADVNVADLTAEMSQFPWFHGTLTRSEAARMVLQSEAAGHGYFLVRQSETRRGEFVLTFNFQGRAKHLRLTISEKGQCRVQHLWFPSIQEMLEHFRHNPIPLESGGTSDVVLTDWVHNTSRLNDLSAAGASMAAGGGAHEAHGQQHHDPAAAGGGPTNGNGNGQGHAAGGGGAAGGGHPSPRHCSEIITMNLSVRLKTNEIELPLEQPTHVYFPEQTYFPLDSTTLTVHSSPPAGQGFLDQPHLRASNASLQGSAHHQQQQQQHQAVQGGNASGSGASGGSGTEGSGRAVDNQYSFT
ncbi:SH2B adapter protein 1 isoform X1 [Drosophila miranda]|uniref:SH2B adapter protein 1 isoform X1 n=1 Tax=Drosophila miranda TaxID=7229 RepID=UPI0007E8A5BD|nr:SH2B adapter protein 1 isoform X1 [Drosophila miranda]XP_017144052.1 SH2B adapter protein 1 isoform X1 [Drosophila miranda]